jgi:5-methylcytosine-specific restriction protein A
MPWLTAHPCRYPGCGTLIRGRGGYCQAHRSNVRRREDELRPSPAARGYDGAWRRRRAAYLEDHPVCATPRCGAPSTEVDHIVPLNAGGEDHETNYQALCKSCHSIKTGRQDRPRMRAARVSP